MAESQEEAAATPAQPSSADNVALGEGPLALARLLSEPEQPPYGSLLGILLFALVLAIHVGILAWLALRPEPILPVVPVQVPPMEIEFAAAPAPPAAPAQSTPPQPQETPQPPEPTPQVEDELAKKPPKLKPKPKPQHKPAPVPPRQTAQTQATGQSGNPASKVGVAGGKGAPGSTGTSTAAGAPKVTPPSASAGYLHNPPPEYPPMAIRRGWEGLVLLKVHVRANGKPSDVQVQKSSGYAMLDRAAAKAVKGWTFVPAKRGGQVMEGDVIVPVNFKLNN